MLRLPTCRLAGGRVDTRRVRGCARLAPRADRAVPAPRGSLGTKRQAACAKMACVPPGVALMRRGLHGSTRSLATTHARRAALVGARGRAAALAPPEGDAPLGEVVRRDLARDVVAD